MEFASKRFKVDLNELKSLDMDVNESTSFVHMVDDCIETVFGWLTLDDLSSVSSTCKKLNGLAGELFQRNYKENEMGFRLRNVGFEKEINEKYKEHLFKYVRNVKVAGHLSESVPINSFHYLKLNCFENLKEIQFYWMIFDPNVPYGELLQNELMNLESIAFISCSMNDLIQTFLKFCLNLKHITIKDGFAPLHKHFDEKWSKVTIRGLESLTYYIDHEKYRDNLMQFIQLNQQLKNLACSGVNVMQSIVQSPIAFDHLSFRFYNETEFEQAFEILKFTTCSAKTIQLIFDTPINADSINLLTVFGSLVPVHALHFTHVCDFNSNDEQFTLMLNSFQRLKILHLKFADLSTNDILSISTNLPYLCELHLRQYFGNRYRIFHEKNGLKDFLMTFVKNTKNLQIIAIHGLEANDRYEFNSNDANIIIIDDLIELSANRKKVVGSCPITIYFDYDFICKLELKQKQHEHALVRIRPMSELKRDRFSNESLLFV